MLALPDPSTLSLRERKEKLAEAIHEKRVREERRKQSNPDGGLLAFIRYFWRILEPVDPFVEGWPLECLCAHLEGITRGDPIEIAGGERKFNRLLANVPPGFMKSLTVNVFWPAWEWGPMGLPHLRYVAFSYSPELTERDNAKFRDLIISPSYREMWGHVFTVIGDGKIVVSNDKTGFKRATSIGGVGTGERGHRVLIDDIHKLKGTQETTEARASVTTWVKEGAQNRLNDLSRDAIVVVMQRLYDDDASGEIMKHLGDEYCHLIIPMEFEDGRHFTHFTGWNEGMDPRTKDGDLAWPERYPLKSLISFKRNKYLWAGQYQQTPTPREGGIILEEWWQLWPQDHFPSCEYKWAFADTAYTQKESNDPTGFTLWGLFYENGDPKVILMDAWRKRLELHGPNKWTEKDRNKTERLKRVQSWMRSSAAYYSKNEGGPTPLIDVDVEPWASYIEFGHNSIDKWPNEPKPVWVMRTQEKWGLCEWLAHSCQRFGVHKLIVEAKASGLSVVQELQRLHGSEGWGIEGKPPKGDKYTRLHAVQSLFSQGLVYAPDREWAANVIDEVIGFPNRPHDDLTDSTSGALEHIREIGLLVTRDQRLLEVQQSAMYQRPTTPLYDV